jgi:hypothetical protein
LRPTTLLARRCGGWKVGVPGVWVKEWRFVGP